MRDLRETLRESIDLQMDSSELFEEPILTLEAAYLGVGRSIH